MSGPEQPAAVLCTIIVAVTGELVGLLAVNDGMLPEPLEGRLIVGLLLVQLIVDPLTEGIKLINLMIRLI